MPANPDFDDIVTTTLRNRSGKLADNATVTTAFLDRLRRKGKVKPAEGGRTIVQELEVSLNPNGGWYAGLDPLNTNLHEPFSAAEFDWKQCYVPAVWSGLDKLKNQGELATINLVSARIKNSEKTLVDLVAQAAYSDGTSFGGKQMQGLGLFVVTSPGTGSVGGIDRAGNTFWRNQTAICTQGAINIAASNPSNYLAALNSLSISCTRGSDRPDLYVADAVHYRFYLESLQPLQRITNTDMAGFGFTALKYYGVGGNADFVLDNGYCPANTTFALNTDYLYLRPHPDRNFVPFGGDRIPTNQDGTVAFVGFTGNMCVSNMARQGRLFQN
ncbi:MULTISPECIES: phage major capsid protein [Rhodomicrobium]|uniref:phage major capsid protein n=1 Tax=Rhodomicrobium TaxID=1068 RepID=UPI000B4BE533|nr:MULTISPECIES: phage major capsid protein [Rhodomicrobium]